MTKYFNLWFSAGLDYLYCSNLPFFFKTPYLIRLFEILTYSKKIKFNPKKKSFYPKLRKFLTLITENCISMMVELTKTEEKIMIILWNLKTAKLNDIIVQYPDPKPAPNTLSTMLASLVKKGHVGFTGKARSYVYVPKLSKLQFTNDRLKYYLETYFNGNIEKFKSHIDILDL